MSMIDSGVRLRANDKTYFLVGNRDLTDKKVIVYNEGNMGMELVDTNHVSASPAHVKVDGAEKAFRAYVSKSLGHGYWQGGNFGYIHQWDTIENKPLLYQYPFSGAGIDLDFPVVASLDGESKVGNWWLGAGGWFEIVEPMWTDPSWDWVSQVISYFTDKTKCNGRACAYRAGDTYYLRIWTLTNGIWGYVTQSGWDGIDEDLEIGGLRFLIIWKSDGDIYYIIRASYRSNSYFKNGLRIQSGFGLWGTNWGIKVSSNYSYMRTRGANYSVINIFSKTEKVDDIWFTAERFRHFCLVNTDKCFITNAYGGWKYNYIIGSTVSEELSLPASPSGDYGYFDGGEAGKAIRRASNDSVEGFDPVAGTWTDYGRPWG